MITRSSNCAQYTDTISTLVTGTASVPGDPRCSMTMEPVFSCQTRRFEAPDDTTRAQMEARASAALTSAGCDASRAQYAFNTNLVGSNSREYSVDELRNYGLCSNCFRSGNDVNQATHQVSAECSPMYEMLDEAGRKVKNTNMKVHASLHTCDVSDDGMPQVYEDVQKVAAANLADIGFRVERPEHLACTFRTLPR